MPYTWRNPTATCFTLLLLAACSDTSGPDLQGVGSVAITAPLTELAVGGTVQLQATILNQTGAVLSGGHVDWTSSDHAVATVSTGGLVSAHAAGITTITARSGDQSDDVIIRVSPPPCTSATDGTVSLGQTRSATLGATDCLLPHGGPGRSWRLDLAAATSIEVELSSSAFEPLIWITDLQMNVMNVYANGQADVRMYQMLQAGSYLVWASSGDLQEGAFQVAVRQAPPACTTANRGSIEPGDTRDGSLGDGDCVFHDAVPAHGWQLDLENTTRIQVDLTSDQFDPLILITDPAMNVLIGNDGDGGNARLVTTLPAGSYFIWVVALDGGNGAFTLSLNIGEPYSCPNPADSTALGESVNGTLAHGDCLLQNGALADAWTFSLADAASVRIDLTSTQFDTFLILSDTAGVDLAFNDDGGDGLNSRIDIDLPAGAYTIWVSSYLPGMTGSYQLAVQPLAAGMLAGTAAASAGSAKVLRWLGELQVRRTESASRSLPPDVLRYLSRDRP